MSCRKIVSKNLQLTLLIYSKWSNIPIYARVFLGSVSRSCLANLGSMDSEPTQKDVQVFIGARDQSEAAIAGDALSALGVSLGQTRDSKYDVTTPHRTQVTVVNCPLHAYPTKLDSWTRWWTVDNSVTDPQTKRTCWNKLAQCHTFEGFLQISKNFTCLFWSFVFSVASTQEKSKHTC